jgi:hypothetical protein
MKLRMLAAAAAAATATFALPTAARIAMVDDLRHNPRS